MAQDRPPLLWSPEAQTDLSEIWTYHADAASPRVADGILRAIGAVCSTLEQHPLAGRRREEIAPNLRSMPASPHVVFYRVGPETVEIVRVLHGSRDVDEIFSDWRDQ